MNGRTGPAFLRPLAARPGLRVSGTLLLLALAAVLGVLLRIFFVQMHAIAEGGRPLFTLESALLLRYVWMVASGIPIPALDAWIESPAGIHPAQTFPLWAEYLYGWLCRLSGYAGGDVEPCLRVVIPAVFCLGLAGVFLAVRSMTRNTTASLLAALLYGVALPSVIRSAGLEVSDENTALPLFSLHLWLTLAYFRRPSLAAACAAGLVLGAAVGFWDLMQLYALLVLVWSLGVGLLRRESAREAAGFSLVQAAGLLAAAVCSPYQTAHGLVIQWLGPPVLCAVALWALAGRRRACTAGAWVLILAAWGAGCLLLPHNPSAQPYTHFGTLLFYKLRYFNIRPEIPSQLPFDVRVLWAPALQSTGAGVFLCLFGRAGLVAAASWLFPPPADAPQTVRAPSPVGFLLAVFLVLTAFFFRLHVFAAPLVCVQAGVWTARLLSISSAPGVLALLPAALAASLLGPGATAAGMALLAGAGLLSRLGVRVPPAPGMRWAGVAAVLLLLETEAANTLRQSSAWGRSYYPRETRALLGWMATQTPKGASVLAPFGISPLVLTFSERPIVLQPKYESAQLRDKVRRFSKSLFSDREEDFYGFCLENDVGYYLHARGTWSDTSPYSWRYISDTISCKNPESITCFKFEEHPGLLEYFEPVYASGKYAVFRVMNPERIRSARMAFNQGSGFLQTHEPAKARECFLKALAINPQDIRSRRGLAVATQQSSRRPVPEQSASRSAADPLL